MYVADRILTLMQFVHHFVTSNSLDFLIDVGLGAGLHSAPASVHFPRHYQIVIRCHNVCSTRHTRVKTA